jgi:hypothetical protein
MADYQNLGVMFPEGKLPDSHSEQQIDPSHDTNREVSSQTTYNLENVATTFSNNLIHDQHNTYNCNAEDYDGDQVSINITSHFSDSELDLDKACTTITSITDRNLHPHGNSSTRSISPTCWMDIYDK